MPNDRYRTADRTKVHGGSPVKRDRAAYPTLAERRTRAEQAAADGAIVMAEIEERDKAQRANMERLKAERLARRGSIEGHD